MDWQNGKFSGQTSDYRNSNLQLKEEFTKLCDIIEKMLDLKNWKKQAKKQKELTKMTFEQLKQTRKYDYSKV